MKITHVNPGSIYESMQSRGYTQVVVAENPTKLITLAGHMPLDNEGKLVGPGDIEAQTRAVYENMRKSLESVGAGLANVLRMTTYVIDLGQAPLIRKVRTEYFGRETPPASTMIEISRLPPGVLIEVEALAAL
jgi:enamine deaminase RidA (YjgF/YER057c/UK114 family)